MGIRTNVQVFYATTWVQEFTIAPIVDISAYTWAFTVRDRFQGAILLQKTTGAGILTLNGPNALWQVSLIKADLTTWLTGANVQPGKYYYDMQVTNSGFEDVTHYGDFVVLPSMLSN